MRLTKFALLLLILLLISRRTQGGKVNPEFDEEDDDEEEEEDDDEIPGNIIFRSNSVTFCHTFAADICAWKQIEHLLQG